MKYRFVGLTVLWLICAATSTAGADPDPSKCTLGVNLAAAKRPFISLGGSTAGNPDNCSDGRCADYTVEVRDALNNIIVGSILTIDFTACCDMQLSCDQLPAVTGQTYVAQGKVSGATGANGRFTFKLQGAGKAGLQPAPGQSPGMFLGVPCATVTADGVPLGILKVSAYDYNGLGSPTQAVNATDVSLIASDWLNGKQTGIRYQRTDVNADGVVDTLDVLFVRDAMLNALTGTGSQKTSPFCPTSSTCPPLPTHTIQIDARTIPDAAFSLDGYPTCYDSRQIQPVDLVAYPSHTLAPCGVACGIRPAITFGVAEDGTITYDPALEPAVSGAGTTTLVVNSFVFPPRGDDVEQSVGQFSILVNTKFKGIMSGYPGYTETAWVHRLVSPVLFDSQTRIGRSNLILEGIPDNQTTPVGAAGTPISDDMIPVFPVGFEGPPGTPELKTEIRTLNMHEVNGTAVRAGTLNTSRPLSPGVIQSKAGSTGFYPAHSFFDVFVEIDLPLLGGNPGVTTLYNSTPLLLKNENLTCIPPSVVYLHEKVSGADAVKLRFKFADPQVPARWAANDFFGWVVLGGHGIDFSSTMLAKGTANVIAQSDLSQFLAAMAAAPEMADTATRNTDMIDILTTIPVSFFALPEQRDSMLASLDAAALAMSENDPCAAIILLENKRMRVDGNATPLADWVSDPAARKALYDRISGLIQEDIAQSLLEGGCTVGVGDAPPVMGFAIRYIRPNPTTGMAAIGFTLGRATHLTVGVYDLGGRRLRTLFDGEQPAGFRDLTWDGRRQDGGRATNGIYFVRMATPSVTIVRKLVVAH